MGLTHKAFAEKSGIPLPSHKNYEGGSSVPGGEALAGYIKAGININWLLTGEGPMLLKDLAQGADGIKWDLMQDVMEVIEKLIEAENRPMEPNLKARMTLAMYKYYENKDLDKHFAETLPARDRDLVMDIIKIAMETGESSGRETQQGRQTKRSTDARRMAPSGSEEDG